MSEPHPPRTFKFERSSKSRKWMRYPDLTLWQHDADFVILAQERILTDGPVTTEVETDEPGYPVAFRVERRLIQRSSPVITAMVKHLGRKMKGLNPIALVDGFTILRLDDNATDVAFLLKFLYEQANFKVANIMDTPRLSAVLRLSRKYEMNGIYQSVVTQLFLDFPPTLARWDSRERSRCRYGPTGFANMHPIQVVNLAHEVDIRKLLPSAYYDLAMYRVSDVVKGCGGETGDDRPHTKLSELDLGKFIVGKERLRSWLSAFIRDEIDTRARILSGNCEELPDSRRCIDAFGSLLEMALRWTVSGGLDEADPLRMLGIIERDEDTLKPSVTACDSCQGEFMAVVVHARIECWDSLGTWFELPEIEEE